MKHFCVDVLPGKYGLTISREKYAIINKRNSLDWFYPEWCEDEDGEYYTDEWCNTHQHNCLINYDLNMEYFSHLDHNEFETELQQFVRKYPSFVEITDLNTCKHLSGYYIMILDQYNQAYIGTSRNIYNRIREHWSKNTPFDRLLFPIDAIYSSILSINSFRALDTTRIFICENRKTFSFENEYIESFTSKFLLNRIAGGRFDSTLIDRIKLISSSKSHQLLL